MGGIFTNVFGFLVSIGVGVWAIAIFIVTSPQERMSRACAPVSWVGTVAESLTLLMELSPKSTLATARAFDNAFYGCKFTVWRLFYENDWKAEQGAQQKAGQEASERARRQAPVRPQPPASIPLNLNE